MTSRKVTVAGRALAFATGAAITTASAPADVSADQVTTLLWLAFVVVGLPVVGIAIVAWLEVRTLRDGITGNHITASVRAAFRAQPGAFVVLGGVWGAFLLALLLGIAGHVFWGIGG